MRRILQAALIACALAIAPSASAQYTFLAPDRAPPPLRLHGWDHVVRLNLGAGFYNSGWYNCSYDWYAGTCPAGDYASYLPFQVGPQIDFNLGGVANLSAGLTVSIGTVKARYLEGTVEVEKSAQVTLWEPTLDFVVKPGSNTQETVARFRIGGGLYIGPDSQLGGVGRLGVGASFFSVGRFGLGVDAVLEAGTYNGYWIGGLQLMASPELHF
jgi:hypothetical protein